jgi:ATP-dependent Zn protease
LIEPSIRYFWCGAGECASWGPIAFQADEGQPFLGYELAWGRDYREAIAARIDQQVECRLEERLESIRRLVSEERKQRDHLVQTLLHEETIDQDALVQILGPRPEPARDVLDGANI